MRASGAEQQASRLKAFIAWLRDVGKAEISALLRGRDARLCGSRELRCGFRQSYAIADLDPFGFGSRVDANGQTFCRANSSLPFDDGDLVGCIGGVLFRRDVNDGFGIDDGFARGIHVLRFASEDGNDTGGSRAAEILGEADAVS